MGTSCICNSGFVRRRETDGEVTVASGARDSKTTKGENPWKRNSQIRVTGVSSGIRPGAAKRGRRQSERHKVLVTGAGLLGVAAIEKFLSADWDVVGVSLRKPKLPSGRDIEFLSVDLRDEGKAARAAFEPLTGRHSHRLHGYI